MHPESYPVVRRIVAATGGDVRSLLGNGSVLHALQPADFVDDFFGLPTVTDILAELEKPGRDPRPEFRTATFTEGVEKVADLQPGMVLEGVVTNVAAFGAFVDVGVHQDGLVHVSAMSAGYVADPRDVVKSGDVVKVKVLSVDVARNRIGLSLRLDEENERRPRDGRRPGGGRPSGDAPGGGQGRPGGRGPGGRGRAGAPDGERGGSGGAAGSRGPGGGGRAGAPDGERGGSGDAAGGRAGQGRGDRARGGRHRGGRGDDRGSGAQSDRDGGHGSELRGDRRVGGPSDPHGTDQDGDRRSGARRDGHRDGGRDTGRRGDRRGDRHGGGQSGDGGGGSGGRGSDDRRNRPEPSGAMADALRRAGFTGSGESGDRDRSRRS